MTNQNPHADLMALEDSLRAYARKLQRSYGRRRASRFLGVNSEELFRWLTHDECPHVALNVLHRLETDNPAEIRKITRKLPGWRGGGTCCA